jgi:uncharacterized protein YjbJ (UPF0337 family)
MNKDQLAGNWEQMKGHLTQKWGKLTGDDFRAAKGDMKVLAGKLQEHYGLVKEDAETQLRDYVNQYNEPHKKDPEVAKEGAPVNTDTLKIGM